MENKEKYTASHIANYFLWRAWKEQIDITQMKLMKLVCISYGWNLVMNDNKKLFEEPILAWKYGLVIPSIYHEFKEFRNNPITKGNYSFIFTDYKEDGAIKGLEVPTIREDDTHILKILNAEWNNYKDFDSIELSEIFDEDYILWIKAKQQGINTRLDDEDIKQQSLKIINKLMENEN